MARPSLTEILRARYETQLNEFRKIAGGGSVDFASEEHQIGDDDDALPRINVSGRRRAVKLNPRQKKMITPYATIYSSRNSESARPGLFRGLDIIGLAIMKALGASDKLIEDVKKAHREDFQRAKKQIGARKKR